MDIFHDHILGHVKIYMRKIPNSPDAAFNKGFRDGDRCCLGDGYYGYIYLVVFQKGRHNVYIHYRDIPYASPYELTVAVEDGLKAEAPVFKALVAGKRAP